MGAKPVLWHIPVSHYSEKARWALAHKGIEHERRAPPPAAHIAVALWLTRGRSRTFPVLELEGEAIGDSAAIIAALERHRPEPRLFPADPAARERALELARHFDEQLGPPMRRYAWHELTRDRERMRELSAETLPAALRGSRLARAGAATAAGAFVRARYGTADEREAEVARDRVLAALDRLDAELEAAGGEYLAGGEFSVADLTAAALLYPLVLPPQGPRVPSPPPAFEAFRSSQRERPAFAWVAEMFRRHRAPG